MSGTRGKARRLTEVVILMVFGSCTSVALGFVAPIQIVVLLAIGWYRHLARTLPLVTVEPLAVAGAVLSVGILAGGGHLALGWLRRHLQPSAGPWRFAWTAAGLGLVVALFGAAITSAGVAHQLGWLARSGDVIRSTWDSPRMDVRRHCSWVADRLAEGLAGPEIHARVDEERPMLREHFHLVVTSTSALLVPRDPAALHDLGGLRCSAGQRSEQVPFEAIEAELFDRGAARARP